MCTAWGDPHYITFDGRKYDYQGDCDYTLVKDCINSTDLPSFHLAVRNYKNKPSDRVAYTQEVHLEYSDSLFSLLQGSEVQLDGVTVALPLFHQSGVTIRNVGNFVVSESQKSIHFEYHYITNVDIKNSCYLFVATVKEY